LCSQNTSCGPTVKVNTLFLYTKNLILEKNVELEKDTDMRMAGRKTSLACVVKNKLRSDCKGKYDSCMPKYTLFLYTKNLILEKNVELEKDSKILTNEDFQ